METERTKGQPGEDGARRGGLALAEQTVQMFE